MRIIISHNARTPDNLLHCLTADAIALCRGAIALTESCGTFSLSEDAGSITGGNSEVSVVYRLGTHVVSYYFRWVQQEVHEYSAGIQYAVR